MKFLNVQGIRLQLLTLVLSASCSEVPASNQGEVNREGTSVVASEQPPDVVAGGGGGGMAGSGGSAVAVVANANAGASADPLGAAGGAKTAPAETGGVAGMAGDSGGAAGVPLTEDEEAAGVASSGGGAAGAGGGAAGAGGASDGEAGGSSSEPGETIESFGCNSGLTPEPCDDSGSPCAMDVDGTEREFYVVLPDDYDQSIAYPVVFQFHPLGGSAEQGMTMYGVRSNFPDAIYVTPQGLEGGQYTGFSNTDDEDEIMTRAIIADIESKYCIDTSRYFSTGFSFGGSMSYTAACNMSDIFRGVAAMAGAPISGANCGSTQPERPVAFWGSHGSEDSALPVDMALPIRDAFIERNGCSEETQSVEPSPCVTYENCDEGYPVVWCLVEGQGHAIPDNGPEAIAEFFQQF